MSNGGWKSNNTYFIIYILKIKKISEGLGKVSLNLQF